MFAALHLACLSEEVRELTLDALLQAAELGSDSMFKAKVAAVEFYVMEGIGFGLLIEPKPATGLDAICRSLRAALPHAADEKKWTEACATAQAYVVRVAALTDAVLRWPATILLVVSLQRALVGVVPDDIHAVFVDTFCKDLPTEKQRDAVNSLLKEAIISMPSLEDTLHVPSEEEVKDVTKVGASRNLLERSNS
eukprot:5354804-Amphidinium_carterae.1